VGVSIVPSMVADSPNGTDHQAPPTISVAKKKPLKTRGKRISDTDIRKAIKLVYDENITQKEAEKRCQLPRGTLSKPKGKEIMAEYRQTWGTPTMFNTQHGVSRKELEKSFIYGDN
jgi:predicted DNA-binding protein (UPF0251 family)